MFQSHRGRTLTRLRLEEIAMALSGAYEKYPQHRIDIDQERVRLQVSLDGPPVIHDHGRIFPDGRGTHAEVMLRLAQIR